MTTRRDFLSLTALAGAGIALTPAAQAQSESQRLTPEAVLDLKPPKQPVIVTRTTGDDTIQQAWKMLSDGSDTLDAAFHICTGRENDPTDHSVGLGGLPDENGIVQLDACCMHGPSRTAGAVGAMPDIKNACLVARAIMNHTGHIMLIGKGARKFATDMGFPRENLLTDSARKIFMLWKENHTEKDWWGPGLDSPKWKDPYANRPAPRVNMDLHGASLVLPGRIPRHPTPDWEVTIHHHAARLLEMAADLGIPAQDRLFAAEQILWPTTGTIHVSVVNAKGEISGATTTSGTAWKLNGRVGDSPIIAAGCYTDQDVGSAGATGSGEENIKVAGAHTIVELMRQGYSPRDAGMETLRRIVRNYNGDMKKLRYVDMEYYILRKDGAYAGVSLWSHGPTGSPRVFVVNDGSHRVEKCTALLQGSLINWPPF